MENSRHHIPELDGIRGIACLAVLFAHCFAGLETSVDPGAAYVAWRTALSLMLPLLLGGVDLFFVLSGFLIGGILLDHKGSENYFRVFWTRRAARILPVLFVLVLSYVIALALNDHFHFKAWDAWLMQEPRPPIWSYLTFTQTYFMVHTGIPQPRWTGITWSLAIEGSFTFSSP